MKNEKPCVTKMSQNVAKRCPNGILLCILMLIVISSFQEDQFSIVSEGILAEVEVIEHPKEKELGMSAVSSIHPIQSSLSNSNNSLSLFELTLSSLSNFNISAMSFGSENQFNISDNELTEDLDEKTISVTVVKRRPVTTVNDSDDRKDAVDQNENSDNPRTSRKSLKGEILPDSFRRSSANSVSILSSTPADGATDTICRINQRSHSFTRRLSLFKSKYCTQCGDR